MGGLLLFWVGCVTVREWALGSLPGACVGWSRRGFAVVGGLCGGGAGVVLVVLAEFLFWWGGSCNSIGF